MELSGNVIFFVKEVHHIFDAAMSGACSFAYNLKHALERGVIQCMFSTTVNEHKMHIENDTTLKRIFQPVKVVEPSVEETTQILKGLCGTYKSRYKLPCTMKLLLRLEICLSNISSVRLIPSLRKDFQNNRKMQGKGTWFVERM